MRVATILPVLAIAAGCSDCGREPVRPDAAPPDGPDVVDVEPAREEEARLPKHDWNGLTVMMREAEVREALEAVGFKLVPSRLEAFPVLDVKEHEVELVPIQGYTPPLVIMETEKSDSPLSSVYGLRLYFHRNRLYAFQPVYYADPVDLVEPGDEAVPPVVMKRRLLETFGDPSWVTQSVDITPAREEPQRRSQTAWADKDLVVLFGTAEGDGPPSYDLYFFSPRGNKLVAGLVSRLEKKAREKGTP